MTTEPRCWRPGCSKPAPYRLASWWGAVHSCDSGHLKVARAVTGVTPVRIRTWRDGSSGALFEVEER